MTRFGIAEWYGQPFLSLPPGKRRELAAAALERAKTPECPFGGGTCNKRGGVCSIQPYDSNGGAIGEAAGNPVITCPRRFEQGRTVVHWLAEIVGFAAEDVLLAREVPFMHSKGTSKPAGKIDLVLAADKERLTWYGLEIQAVYFSGEGMESEFQTLYNSNESRPPFPAAVRRPDWRSSSAKRLMPQLQVKGPTLRRWHSKIAVAVDRPFFAAIGGPSNEISHDLDAGDVIWLVPEIGIDYELKRGHWEVLTLEDSATKLLSASPIPRKQFEELLRERLVPLKEH